MLGVSAASARLSVTGDDAANVLALENRWEGVLTGKGCAFGGSAVRSEATGYGRVYFCKNMLEEGDEDLKDIAVCEGANMPLTSDDAAVLRDNRIFHAPGNPPMRVVSP